MRMGKSSYCLTGGGGQEHWLIHLDLHRIQIGSRKNVSTIAGTNFQTCLTDFQICIGCKTLCPSLSPSLCVRERVRKQVGHSYE